MRIGIFDPYLDTLGGGERYMLAIASCLSKHHEAYVFWDDPLILNKASDRFSLDLSNVHLSENIFSTKHFFFKRLLTSYRFDCIFFLSDGSIPFVFSKNIFIHFQFPVEWVNNRMLLNKIKLARVKQILCNSEFTKRYIDKKFGVKSVVIYPPSNIGISNQKSKITDKKNVILTVGRFGKLAEGRNFKKQDVLIETFKKMVDKGLSNWKLVIVISYREQDISDIGYLKNMIGDYPIETYENLRSDILDQKYKEAKIYWHAVGFEEDLHKHPELAEHFGMATVEAMARGAVPVVFDAGGQKEIVENNINGLLWDTIDELIEKTYDLTRNTKLWKTMSDKAIKRAHAFGGNDRFCKQINAFIL